MSEDKAKYLVWLEAECGYTNIRLLPDGRWAAIMPLLFTAAIIVGRLGDLHSYDDRWCYLDEDSARAALSAWSGEGEPEGWHRHPATGRRVERRDRPAGQPLPEGFSP